MTSKVLGERSERFLVAHVRHAKTKAAPLEYWKQDTEFERELWEGGEVDFRLLDPCSCSDTDAISVGGHSIPRATERFWKGNCGLSADWNADAVYLNPPSSRQKEFCEKFIVELEKGSFTFGLILLPAYTSAIWVSQMQSHPCVVSHVPLVRQKFIRGNMPSSTQSRTGADPQDRMLLFVDRNLLDFKHERTEQIALRCAAAAKHFALFFKTFTPLKDAYIVHLPV